VNNKTFILNLQWFASEVTQAALDHNLFLQTYMHTSTFMGSWIWCNQSNES